MKANSWLLTLFCGMIVQHSVVSFKTIIVSDCGGLSAHQYMNINETEPAGTELIKVNGLKLNTEFRLLNANNDDIEAKKNISVGIISLKRKPDYEKVQNIKITVICDGAGYHIGIGVNNIVEGKLSFYQPTYHGSVTEDAKIGTVIIPNIKIDTSDIGTNNIAYGVSLTEFKLSYAGPGLVNLILAKSLNYASKHRYNFTGKVSDSNYPDRNGTTRFIINVTDVDNLVPVFHRTRYTVNVNENATLNTAVVTIHAYDQDKGIDEEINYKLVYEIPDTKWFSVNQRTGVVTVSKTLDREKYSQVTLVIKGYQVDKELTRFAHTAVDISIIDINEFPPEFEKTIYNISITENSQTPMIILPLRATDKDMVSGKDQSIDLIYSIVDGKSSHYFSINSSSGVLSLSKSLDFETDPSHTIQVTVKDAKYTSTATVSITVIDINDNNPVFDNSSYSFNIKKTKGVNDIIGSVNARDKDSNAKTIISYAIKDTSFKIFGVDSNTGELTLKTNLSENFSSLYTFEVVVKDGNTAAARQNSAVVNVHVSDVNIHPPQFEKKTYQLSVLEDVAVNTKLLYLKGTDKDPSDVLKYSISSGNSGGFFSINNSSGVLSLAKSLDFETDSSHTMKVTVNDAKHTSTATVSITVIDINDNNPVFDNSSYSFYIKKTKGVNDIIGSVNAIDKDSNAKTIINYAIKDTSFKIFGVDSNTGELTLKTNLSENFSSLYTFEVVVKDGNTAAARQNSAVVYVHVSDVNIHQPQFEKKTYQLSALEDVAVNTKLLYLKATDKDPSDVLKYSISRGNSGGLFSISNTSGVLSLAHSLDFEIDSKHTIQVTVSDSSHVSTTTVSITVIDINDNKPIFNNASYNFNNISEESPQIIVGHVMATDKDKGNNSLLSYSIETPWSQNFTIDRNGLIRVHGALDREVLGKSGDIKLVVMATDQGDPPLTGTTEVIVHVKDVNDHCPYYSEEDKEVTYVFKELDQPRNFHDCWIHDDDTTDQNRQNSFSGVPNPFNITVDKTGSHVNHVWVYAKKKLQINQDGIKEKNIVQIKWYNSQCPGKQEAIQNVTIIIQDVNDHSPVFSKTNFTLKPIGEDKEVGGKVNDLRIQAIDVDPTEEFNTVHYSIQSGNNGGHFRIDELSGDIYLVKKLDYETVKKYNLVIGATDRKPFYNEPGKPAKTSTATVVVNVTDVNDNKPKFDKDLYQCTVRENTTGSVPDCKLSATDNDTGVNGNLTYKSLDNCFVVDSSGQVIVNKALDYELDEREYTVSVQAIDNGNPKLTGSTTVIINVNDTNDNPPQFDGPYHFTLSENQPSGTIVGVVKATDVDTQTTLKYTVISSDFSIDKDNGIITSKKPFDYETIKKLNITVQVSDGEHTVSTLVIVGIRNLNDNQPIFTTNTYYIEVNTTTVSITVIDINDNKPIFNKVSYIFNNISEESPQIIVGHVMAIDKDKGNNSLLSYSIETPWNTNFTISDTGHIKVKSKLDRESIENDKGEIKFVVIATDHGLPSLTGSTEVTVEVKDVNDHCPYFNLQDLKFTYVFNDLSTPRNFHQVQAQDMDKTPKNRQMKYSFIGSHDGFIVYQATGKLSASKPLKMENTNKGQITLKIAVFNAPVCNSSHTATQTVVINVQDVNRFTPVFKSSSYNFTKRESLDVGSSISDNSIIAGDKDSSPQYNTVTYWISSGDPNGHFYMDSRTAEILLVKPLDYEKKTQFTLTIGASDGHILYNGSYINDTATVVINVENVNDNAPQFLQATYKCVFLENKQTSKGGCTIKAKDKDQGSTIKYSLNSTIFKVSGSGEITVSSSGVDYDGRPHQYTIQAVATDNGNLTDTTIVEISIENVNDNSPHFNKNYSFSVKEDAPTDTILGIVSALDEDGGNLTYSIDSTDFEMQPDGVLLTKSSLIDRRSFKFNLIASDTLNTRSTSVTVTVIDVNNHPPVFNENSYSGSVAENKKNINVVQVQATDRDSDLSNKNISYSLIETEWSQNFTIDHNGLIRVHDALDREVLGKSGDIKLVVMATDQGDPPLTGTTEVIVHVKDVNDHCPYYSEEVKEVTYVFKEYEQPINFHDCWIHDDDTTDQNRQNSFGGVRIPFNITVDMTGSHVNHVWVYAKKKLQINQDGIKEKNIVQIKWYNSQCPGKQEAIQNVTIIIQDVNDHSPVFNKTNFTLKPIGEDKKVGGKVNDLRIQAIDVDPTEEFNTVHYSIQSGNNGGHFRIDELSGNIYLVKKLDYETVKKYNLVIGATDRKPFYNEPGKPARISTATVVVSVTDVNDNKPKFDKDLYQCTVKENTIGSVPDCKLSATDNDTGVNGNLTYKSLDNRFVVDSSGQVIVNKTLDYELVEREYTVSVQAIDNGNPKLTGSTTVIINVNDTNDNPPQFDGPYHFTLSENQPSGTIVGVVKATDVDTQTTLKYTVISSDFSIDKDKGIITSKKPFDYETKKKFNITVQVSDGEHTVSTLVIVGIRNLNDNQPIFTNNTYYIEVNTTTVSITVIDINDNKPIFNNASYNFNNISEESPQIIVGHVMATDKDKGNNSLLSYSIETPWSQNFTIDRNGLIRVHGALDREVLGKSGDIKLVVMATDQGDPPLTGTTEVIVHVKDVNDHCPYYSEEDKEVTYVFKELDQPRNFHDCWIHDDDTTDQNRQNSFGGVPNPFNITVDMTGSHVNHVWVYAKKKLQINQDGIKEKNIVQIKWYNSQCPGKQEAIQNVTIIIQDVNDHSPVFNKTNFTLKPIGEDKKVGGKVNDLRIQAIDVDPTEEFNTVHYSIQSGNNGGHFRIDELSGNIYLVKKLDYETVKKYNLVIGATDRKPFYNEPGKPARISTATVVVSVTDVNDNKPKFDKDLYQCTVKENTIGSVPDCKLSATDNDTGVNGNLTYKSLDNRFVVDSSGQVIVNKTLDYELVEREYTVSVQAIDNGNPKLTGSTTVIINVNDTNDNPPQFDGPYHFTLSENQPSGTIVGVVKATDVDTQTTLKYTVISSDFSIDKDKGIITSKKPFDYETKKKFNITVQVSDGEHTVSTLVIVGIRNLNDNQPIFTNNTYYIEVNTTTVSITVIDINDNKPIFNNASYNFNNISEESPHIIVGHVMATDKDKGNNSLLSYSIETPWNTNFTISHLGEIRVKGKLDRESIENDKGEIKFVVMATDHGMPSLTGSREVTVKVKDINDHCPYFNSQDLKFTYVFNELSKPENFHQVQAQDIDKTSENRKMSYSLNGSSFTINQSNGYLSASKHLMMEHTNKGKITLSIVVSNPGCKPAETATQTVVINVQDVNRYNPVFKKASYTFTKKENFVLGSSISDNSIKAEDKDSSPQYNTVTYWISSGDPYGHFYMDSRTADILLVKPLDYENQTQFNLTIHASDGHKLHSGSYTNVTATVTINVQNVNDNAPDFAQAHYKCLFLENRQKSKKGCTIVAHDADPGTKIRYSLNNTVFHISQNGEITSDGVDFDQGIHLYTLQAYASDGSLNSSTIVEIYIENVNDNSPHFNTSYTFSVMEDAPENTVLGIVSATDKDGDDLTYSSSSSDFEMQPNGVLLTKKSLIDETSFKFNVIAQDSNKTGATSVTVNVIDVNNHPPVFVSSSYRKSVNENLRNVDVVTVKAIDQDLNSYNKNISYSLLESEWSSNFSIDGVGLIRVNSALDREVLDKSGDIKLVVMATDQGKPPLTGTTEVIVHVEDVNDHCPYYSEEDKEVTYVFKELDQPRNFHDCWIIDGDATEAHRHNGFSFNGTSLGLKVNVIKIGSNVNHVWFDSTKPFQIDQNGIKEINIVHVRFNSSKCPGPQKDANQYVKIFVQDVNDNSPVFNQTTYKFKIKEDFIQGVKVNDKRIQAIDIDPTEEFNTVHYSIQSGNDGGHFHIDELSGDIYLVKKLDYETVNNYKLVIGATDGKPFYNEPDKSARTSTATVMIGVIDVNDNKPKFDKDYYQCTVRENTIGSVPDCKLSATDNDTGVNGNLTYKSLDNRFVVDSSGQVIVDKALDYELGEREYTVSVQAIDNGNPKLTGSATVIINVNDTNDNPPQFDGQYHFTLSENQPSGTIVGVVKATDLDTQTTLKYTVTSLDFSVDKDNGTITSKKSFDYETKKRYDITVLVLDGEHNASTSVIVGIRNLNDNQPIFTNTTYYIDMEETATLQSSGVINASDEDNLGYLTYDIIGGDTDCHDIFKIDKSTGALSINNTGHCLDYDVSPVHTLLVQAKDEMSGSLVSHSSQTMIWINVRDKDNKPPKFTWKTYTASVKENGSRDQHVVRVVATDPDTPLDKLSYSLVNYTSEFYFQRDVLVTNLTLDAESQNMYFVNVSVSDPGRRTDYAVVEIYVEDENDNPPSFVSANLKIFSIPANAQGNRSVGVIKAADADVTNSGFTYYLPHNDHFWINSQTGELFVMDGRGTNQFEANVTYKVVVMVMDHGQPPKSASTEVDVFIDITNHFPPKFAKMSQISLFENESLNTYVAIVNATDQDPGLAGSVYYKLVQKQVYDGKFILNEKTGQITLNGSLDYEKTKTYELEVLAIDRADDPKTGTTYVHIQVEDVNEKPHFLEKMDGLCIRSPINKNDIVGDVSAEDPDGKDHLLYSLKDSSNFIIDENSGRIRAKQNLRGDNFQITVIVKDKGNLTDTKHINLTNNPSLVITSAIITVHVKENSTNHTITRVNAVSSNQLTYSLSNSTGFTIDRTGLIMSNRPLDREKKSKDEVYVTVTSNGSVCHARVTIDVVDINDNPPRFGFQYDVPQNIPENYSNNTCFFSLPVEDPDLNTKLNFTITKDNSDGKFTIERYNNQTGGCLMLKSSLDYDTMPADLHGMYSLTAEVSDGRYSSSREIKVYIDDVNDNLPKFNDTYYIATTYEELPAHTSIMYLEAYDEDALDAGKLTYSLEGVDSSYFTIRYGDLEVNTILDRENRSSYMVTVVATDSAGHRGTTKVNITVLDINDNPPMFSRNSYTFTHVEGPTSKGFKMKLHTTDPDLGENGTNVFKLMNYGGLFNITTLPNNTGVITVLKELDRESLSVLKENGTAVYNLNIQAVDTGKPSLSATTLVTLSVTDINDCKPEFTRSSYNATVLEGSPKGFSILTVTTSDCDYEPEFTDVNFSLEGPDSDVFVIDNSGEIHLNTKISVKSRKAEYSLTIVANDSLNRNTAPLRVHITDVNDHDPQFTEVIYNFSSPETNRTSYVVGIVSATDDDLGDNGNITYSIISADVKQLFSIDQNGSIRTIGALDRDGCINNRYPFTVIAVDGGESQRTGYTEVVVYITDINDNYPTFSHANYSGTVKENSPNGTGVLILPPITATDKDYGVNGTEGIQYSLVGSDFQFRIDKNTGEVLTNASDLDRESKSEYYMQVKAADRNGTGLSAVVSLTISLLDVNDKAPQFNENNYTFSISESAGSGQKVGVVTTTDDDINGNLTNRYRISSGSDGKFYIDILSGEIYTSGNLDREEKPEYQLNVEAFDGQQKTNTTVHIILQDSNDNCPVFQGTRLVKVPEDTINNTVIYNLTATDEDWGKNGLVSFYMNDSVPFMINDNSFVLNGELDREKQNFYSFSVYAVDHGNPPCFTETTFGVAVEDMNDNYPEFFNADGDQISNAIATIIEKSPIGTPIFLPSVKDIDSGENSEVKFEFLNLAPDLKNYFRIDPKTGVVTINAQVDLNSLNRLNILEKNATQTAELKLEISAMDGGFPSRNTTLDLVVFVEGINDQAPVFLKPVYDIIIAENIPVGSFIETVEAIVQNGTNYKLTYSLIHGTNSQKYFNVAQVSGNITTSSVIDREVTPSFHFAVQVTDGKIPERTAYTVVSITVTDQNDNAPDIEQSSYEYVVEENVVSPGVEIIATDKDSGQNGNVSYQLLHNPDNQFILNARTGLLSINRTLDRETKPYYNLTVVAFDHGNPAKSSSVQVMVTVTDQNDNEPLFTDNTMSCDVTENQPPRTYVCNVTATDPDNSLNGSIVYMFGSTTSYPQFEIDPLDGSISTLESLDYEQQSEYNLTVMAMDLGTPALNSTLDLTIHVRDIYDTAPHFPRSKYEISVDINEPINSFITTVSAGPYGANYNIEDGNRGNHFQINPTSGEITLSSRLGTAVLEYTLNISASDSTTTDYTKVLVHIITGNVEKFNNRFTAFVPENTNGTYRLIDLNYTDGSNAVFKYELQEIIPNVTNVFKLNETTGELFCIAKLDREMMDKYEVHVRAKVSSNRRKRDTLGELLVVIVNVKDENDNPPSFTSNQIITIGVPDTTGVGDLVTTIIADDKDLNSTIQYSISGGKDKDKFGVGSLTGKIYSKIKVKYGRTYTVVLTANDGNFSTSISVKFLVISNSNKVVLTIPIPTSEFEVKNETILRNISTIVGFNVEMEKYGVHVDSRTHTVDLSKTDIYFHGINETVGSVLSQEEAVSIVESKTKEINSLFYPRNITVVRYRTLLVPPQGMSVAEIALVVIGVFIFAATLISIIVAHYTWKQFKSSQKTLQDKIWELNSIHSSQLNGTVSIRQNETGAVNPAFTETSLTTAANNIPSVDLKNKEDTPSKRRREYESQEVVLDLPLEPLEAIVPPRVNGAREMSLGYDSGLENESNSSSSGGENGATGMADQQEIQMETDVEGAVGTGEVTPKEIQVVTGVTEAGQLSGHDVFTFEMETGDTDDDLYEEDSQDDKITRRRSSKKKKAGELKVFSPQSAEDNSDTDVEKQPPESPKHGSLEKTSIESKENSDTDEKNETKDNDSIVSDKIDDQNNDEEKSQSNQEDEITSF